MARIISAARRLVVPIGLTGFQSRWGDGIDDRIVGVDPGIRGAEPWTMATTAYRTRNKGVGSWDGLMSFGEDAAAKAAYIGFTIPVALPTVTAGFRYAAVQSATFGAQVGLWYRIVCTYDGVSVRLYVDGTLRAGPTAQALNIGAGPAELFRMLASNAYAARANQVDARIYARRWSDAEVAADFRGEWVDPTALRRWWKLEDLTNATAHEEIGNTDDAVTGALVSPESPFQPRRIREDVAACCAQTMSVADHADLRPDAVSFGVMGWWRKSGRAGALDWISKIGGGTDVFTINQQASGVLRATLTDGVPVTRTVDGGRIEGRQGWMHVAFTCDRAAGLLRLFINGSMVGQNTVGALGAVSPNLALTVYSTLAYNDLEWRRGAIFTPAEIRARYLDSTIPGVLTSRWPATENAGFDVHDVIGGHDGALGAETWSTDTRSKARIVSAARSAA